MKTRKFRNLFFRSMALVLSAALIFGSAAGCGRNASDDEDREEVSSEKIDREEDDKEKESEAKESKGETHKVTFSYALEEAGEAPETQKIADGEKAAEPQHAAVEGYTFVGWMTAKRRSMPYDFFSPVEEDLSLTGYYLNENDKEDTDGDALPDALEEILDIDPEEWDTDRDGLFDGLEYLLLGLDPAVKDTDDNGTKDGQEDTDGDGLENAAELEVNCNPSLYDTDSDGLNDQEETEIYFTDPQRKDTDEDGVSDGDEVLIGTDPLAAETSFTTAETGEEITENNPVTIEVNAVTDAEGAGTLSIEPLISTDIPALTTGSVGYLGSAYELTCDGELEEATITFTYDPALGEGKEDFLPTIYWYNEEECELIEVPGQIRGNGTVTATVTHFSPYGLFDKNPIDEMRKLLKMPSAEQLAVDENNDGLPDILAEWLSDGTLDFNNTYMLIGVLDMYGDSDDWDDDGLKNGEEISYSIGMLNQVKIDYKSNPVFVDTDGDGFTDYEEVNVLDTSPKRYNHTSGGAYQSLMSDGKYQYATHKMEWAEQKYFDLMPGKEEKAKKYLINYIYDYAPEDTLAENAEKIAKWEEHNKIVDFLSAGSKALKAYKNAYKVYSSAKDVKEQASSKAAKVYYDAVLVNKDCYDAINSKRQALEFSVVGLSDTKTKIEDAIKDMQSDDVADKINGFASIADEVSNGIGLVNDVMTKVQYSFHNDIFTFTSIEKSFKKNKKVFSTQLTVACDLAEGVIDIADTLQTYGKIKANLSAFNRYLELYDYIKNNAEDGFIRNAAQKLEEMVLDTEGAYVEQVSTACAESAAGTFFKTALDVSAAVNPYAKLAKTIIEFYQWTGLEEFTNYNIYFKVMKAVSDGCKARLNELVRVEGSTFCYSSDDYGVVQDYLVQLAQSRIIGQYDLYEYCADNSGAGMLAELIRIIGGDTGKPPSYYTELGKKDIKTIYDYSNRLQLQLSHNLPYFGDYYDDSVPPDDLNVILEPERALKDAAGFYVLSSGAGAWETDLVLNRDGTFYGSYYDMDAGFSGTTEDGVYYDGTQYERTFSGKFEIGEAIDDYSYKLYMTEYHFEGTDGEERIGNDWGASIRHINSPAAGMEGWDTYVLYNPHTPSSNLNYEPWTIFSGDQDYLIGFANQEDEGGKIRSYFLRTKKDLFTSYSKAYTYFLTSKEYRNSYQKFGNEEEILNAFRDLDADGIPELIITNGFSARTDRAAYIYTFSMGQVQYLGIGPNDGYYLDDPKYPGVFGKFETNWTYYRKEGRNIITESVAEGYFDPPFTQITSDDTLYQDFEAGPRKPLYAD